LSQAQYFLDINREAKKVDVNLLWDLLGSISPGSSDGIVSNAAKIMRQMKGGFFEDNIKVPSLGSGKFSFNNICTNLESSELGAERIARRYKSSRNPFWHKDPEKFSSNLAKGVNQYFSQLDSQIDESKKDFLYSDGFIAVMIQIFKLLVVHLPSRPTKNELREFTEVIANYLNLLSEEEGSKLRKSLSSVGGKTDFRNDIVRLLQESYDDNFALGLINSGTSLAEKINHLEFDLNKLVDAVMRQEVGVDWIEDDSVFKDGALRKRIRQRARRDGLEPWEYIPFNYTVNNLVLHPRFWSSHFSELFTENGVGNPEDVKVFARRIWDYRSNKLGHRRSKPIIYSREEEALYRSIYRMFRRIIDDGMSRYII